MSKYTVNIGLEVHVQLNTQSKLFSKAPNGFANCANTQTNFVDAALPGTLPVLNKAAIEYAVWFGLAINAQINQYSYFERKHYAYPDLPKGYQITQNDYPIIGSGYLLIQSSKGPIKISIHHAHLEEDAGKSTHFPELNKTGIDLNRAGNALLEIVSTPCIHSSEDAIEYLKTLLELVRFLGISHGQLEQGEFRCDVNISIKPHDQDELGQKVELKNLNSFKFIKQAIDFEILRQSKQLDMKQAILQETRLFNDKTQTTHPMRVKENMHDYSYLPEPDLPPIMISDDFIINCRKTLKPLPSELKKILSSEYLLDEDDINYLLSHPDIYHYFEKIRINTQARIKSIINWLKGVLTALIKETNSSFQAPFITYMEMAALLNALHNKTITHQKAKDILNQVAHKNGDFNSLLKQFLSSSNQLDANELEALVTKVLNDNINQVTEYKAGKTKLKAYFVGQVMKLSKGQANPENIQHLLEQALDK